jgi:hypothetical protein
MRQSTARGWLWQLVSSAAVVFAFLFALGRPLQAQTTSTLMVSDYDLGGPHYLTFFTTTAVGSAGNLNGTQTGSTLGGGGGEGEACLEGSVNEIFLASNSPSVSTYDTKNASFDPSWFTATIIPPTQPGAVLPNFAGLSLNSSTSTPTLYAAGYVNNYIYAFNTKSAAQITGSPVVGPGPNQVHDVLWDPNNSTLYATYYGGHKVYAYSGTLTRTPASDIPLAPPLTAYEGLALDANGNLFVSDFSTINASQPGVYEYVWDNIINTFVTHQSMPISFSSPYFNHPLGIAAGPGDGYMYVANFGYTPTNGVMYGVLQINPQALLPGASSTAVMGVNLGPSVSGAGSNPKYLQFLENCASTGGGYIEVCKMSCPLNQIPLTGTYDFTVPGSIFGSSGSPLAVSVGQCSGPIQVSAPGGTVDITELPTPGVGVCDITAAGYGPPPFSQYDPNLVESSNLQAGTATVMVAPANAPGDTSTGSVVTYWNYEAPPAELKLCKVAGNGVTPGTSFVFTAVNITNAGSGYAPTPAPQVTITGGGCAAEPTAMAIVSNGQVTAITLTSPGSGCSTSPPLAVAIGTPPTVPAGNIPATAAAAVVSVEAGPPTEGGYCQVVPGTFEVGTSGTVTEFVPVLYAAPTVTVNGISESASCTLPGPVEVPFVPCSAATLIGPGVNEVSFTNSEDPPVPPGTAGDPFSGLSIVNYSLVSQVPGTSTQSYMKYRADLLNTGKTTMGPIVATLTSLDPSGVQVVGQGALNFASAPPKSPVASSNTFTVLTNPAVPLDFSRLSWTYQSRRSIRPVHLKPVADTPLR